MLNSNALPPRFKVLFGSFSFKKKNEGGWVINSIGLYLHVPFCRGKCPYCDFYSLPADQALMDRYTEYMVHRIKGFSEKLQRTADTLYFGGGTPGILGAERISILVWQARKGFGLEDGEITLEINPTGALEGSFFPDAAAAGVNRVSIGLQSADNEELRLLGRRHTAEQAAQTAELARRAGIENLSVDLMLGIQGQTPESLRRSIEFCAGLGVRHVSAYLLKVEPGTWYYEHQKELELPEEETVRELYLLACRELERLGFIQYEISNFAVPGYESRHNLKYWDCREYLGVGPAAHSFLDGRRFYFDRNLEDFLNGAAVQDDGAGGDFEEYAMLRLRLAAGLEEQACRQRFGHGIPPEYLKKAGKYRKAGLAECDARGLRLTREGFLVSNALIGEIL